MSNITASSLKDHDRMIFCKSMVKINSVDPAALGSEASIYRGVCDIAKFAIYREKSRNLLFSAINREVSKLFGKNRDSYISFKIIFIDISCFE